MEAAAGASAAWFLRHSAAVPRQLFISSEHRSSYALRRRFLAGIPGPLAGAVAANGGLNGSFAATQFALRCSVLVPPKRVGQRCPRPFNKELLLRFPFLFLSGEAVCPGAPFEKVIIIVELRLNKQAVPLLFASSAP